ncbi:glycosyltransferase [human gut metagenome]|uniref:Glycosyltransferase n=1 Tax=human gut metagenome TaxID=408170 RepID=K1SET0_9ZZZZ
MKLSAGTFYPAAKRYFIFTDAPSIAHEDDPAVHRIDQPAYDWPLSTMKRFAIFLTQEKALEQLDYLFFFNANLTCREVITPEEFLPRPQQGEQLLLVQQPGFWNKKPRLK